MAEKSWRDAIVKVLEESDTPLHYSEITSQILSRGYYQTDGATPHIRWTVCLEGGIASLGSGYSM
jgi:repressor of nif and glnA expression